MVTIFHGFGPLVGDDVKHLMKFIMPRFVPVGYITRAPVAKNQKSRGEKHKKCSVNVTRPSQFAGHNNSSVF